MMVNTHPPKQTTVGVTGATGYIGGRLVPRLLDAGYRVRCVVRDCEKLRARPWATRPGLDFVQCDLEQDDVAEALRGCDHVYYLVHAMMSGRAYRDQDVRLAQRFAAGAAAANVSRVIYLGGLGETGDNLSEHLASRREVESILRDGPVPCTTFRAAMIIGSGSASFEILRYLVERLPIMTTPKWVRTECQPIAVDNVLTYLVDALKTPETIGRTLDIGCPEVASYEEIMRIMAEARDLPRRLIIPVPVLTPRLSSWWIHLVTPVSHRIARPLAEGLRNRVVCRDNFASELMPQRLLTIREAIDRAIIETAGNEVSTSWTDAGVVPGDPDWAGGTVYEDRRETSIRAGASDIFRAICRVGGGNGYYAADLLWRIRGWMDQLVGGPGLRRGRRNKQTIGYGEALDFWRVTGIERNRSLDLRAEMKLPGVASLGFRIEAGDDENRDQMRLVQIARFKPKGMFGILYWYAVAPLHGIVFNGLLKGIKREAERAARLAET